jgi:hypothetical protein
MNAFQGSKARVENKIGSSNSTVSHFSIDGDGNVIFSDISTRRTDGHDFDIREFFDPPSSNGIAEDIARANFVSNCRKKQTSFQGGQFLGEIRETIHAIKHPADALRKGLSSYLGTVKKRARGFNSKTSYGTVRRMLGGTWLEYAFGWAPLVSDIKAGAEALAKYNGSFTPSLPVRSRGVWEGILDESEYGIATFYGDYSARIITKAKIVATMYGAMRSGIALEVPTVSKTFGLGLRDFVPTVWELIPFSFVTDYFTNVGEILSAGCFDAGDVSWYGMSVKCTGERFSTNIQYIEGTRPLPNISTSVTGSATPGSIYQSAESLSRERAPGLIPSLRFSVPGLRQGFNLAALFASATKTSQDFRRSLKIG